MCVRTDENPEVFVLCGFCRPGANARGKTREKLEKAAFSHFFDSLRPPIAAAFRMIRQIALLLDFAHVNAIEPLDCGVGHFFKRCVAEWRRKTC